MDREPPDSSLANRGHEVIGISLGEYIDEHRSDLEEIAESEYPVSPIVQGLLDRRDRDEIEC